MFVRPCSVIRRFLLDRDVKRSSSSAVIGELRVHVRVEDVGVQLPGDAAGAPDHEPDDRERQALVARQRLLQAVAVAAVVVVRVCRVVTERYVKPELLGPVGS